MKNVQMDRFIWMVLDFIVLVDSVDDERLDPDFAVNILEGFAAQLEELPSDDKKRFLETADAFAEKHTGQKRQITLEFIEMTKETL